MTIVNDDATGTMSVDTAGEGDPSNDNWDPGSYLDAVRKDLASAFAPAPSLPPAFQGTTPSTKPLRIQETRRSSPGRTPIHGRPIILRNLGATARARGSADIEPRPEGKNAGI